MISRLTLICVLLTVNTLAFNTGKLNQFEISSKTECEANRVYQKDEVTCFCNEYGRWPHRNCSLVFGQKAECEPNSYVQVNCNVCRCSKSGNIEKEFCTNHICSADPQDKIIYRRFNNGKSKCELNHWYVISSCRMCFCITRENLLCAAQTNPRNIRLGKYNLTDCGADWLKDINKLLSSVNPLRVGNEIENSVNRSNQADTQSVESQVIVQVHSRPKIESPKDNYKDLNSNRQNNINKKVKIGRNDDKSDNDDRDSSSKSNSRENIKEGKAIARIAGNTAMPFENYEENDSNNSHEIESDREDSGNESVHSKKESEEMDVTNEVESVIDMTKNEPKIVQNVIDQDPAEPLLKLNLPGMLGKVFNFGLRKSMVSINNAYCEPGSTMRVKCNTCFCLTNGKLLCTEKICE